MQELVKKAHIVGTHCCDPGLCTMTPALLCKFTLIICGSTTYMWSFRVHK